MAVQAQSIIDRARTQLIDTGDIQRWTDAELLKWISDGQRTIAAIAPGATSTTGVQPLVAGTKQAIPADGYMLLNIVRNCDASGTTGGRTTRVVSRELLDDMDPDWHTASTSATVRNYIFDPQEPKVFYVYPPNNGAGFVEMIYSVLPAEVTDPTTNLVVQEIYQTPLLDYVLFRAYQKDSDFGTGMAQAQNYLNAFTAFLGQGEQSQIAANPNLQLTPPSPVSKGTAK